jgi:hypothetical protein
MCGMGMVCMVWYGMYGMDGLGPPDYYCILLTDLMWLRPFYHNHVLEGEKCRPYSCRSIGDSEKRLRYYKYIHGI